MFDAGAQQDTMNAFRVSLDSGFTIVARGGRGPFTRGGS
jgi:hypothetical protein